MGHFHDAILQKREEEESNSRSDIFVETECYGRDYQGWKGEVTLTVSRLGLPGLGCRYY